MTAAELDVDVDVDAAGGRGEDVVHDVIVGVEETGVKSDFISYGHV